MAVLLLTLCACAAAAAGAAEPPRGRRWAFAALLGGAALVAALGGGFEARKVAGRLAMPLGLLWLGLFGALIFDLLTRRRRALASGLFFLAYTLAGNVTVGRALMAGLEAEVPDAPRPGGPLDAVLVLGGGTTLGPGGEPELGAAGDRLRLGARLASTGRAERLVASGFSPPPFGLGDLAAHTETLWTQLGVEPRRIVRLPERAPDTRSEVEAFARLARAEGWTRLGLLSSAWHLPRALALAREAGLELIPLAADHHASAPLVFGPLLCVPQRWGFLLVDRWAWERLGRLLGR